jgi:hypothetical protein
VSALTLLALAAAYLLIGIVVTAVLDAFSNRINFCDPLNKADLALGVLLWPLVLSLGLVILAVYALFCLLGSCALWASKTIAGVFK